MKNLRRAIEVIEQENKFGDKNQTETIKAVGIPHMMRIFNDVSPMTNSNLENSTMPIMQKILLCTILLCNKEMKLKEIILSKVNIIVFLLIDKIFIYFNV